MRAPLFVQAPFLLRAPLLVAALAAALDLSGCMPGFPGSSALNPAIEAKGSTPPPVDALARAQEHFRNRNFGLAEKDFEAIVLANPRNADAWLGLGSCHDELGRFDLADKDYAEVEKLTGTSVALLNDRAYSYMMRGDLATARAMFLRAQALDPKNIYVARNIQALDARAAAAPSRVAL